MGPNEKPERPRGVDGVVWDNLGDGWKMYCLCGWVTIPDRQLDAVALDLMDHWEAEHG